MRQAFAGRRGGTRNDRCRFDHGSLIALDGIARITRAFPRKDDPGFRSRNEIKNPDFFRVSIKDGRIQPKSDLVFDCVTIKADVECVMRERVRVLDLRVLDFKDPVFAGFTQSLERFQISRNQEADRDLCFSAFS